MQVLQGSACLCAGSLGTDDLGDEGCRRVWGKPCDETFHVCIRIREVLFHPQRFQVNGAELCSARHRSNSTAEERVSVTRDRNSPDIRAIVITGMRCSQGPTAVGSSKGHDLVAVPACVGQILR